MAAANTDKLKKLSRKWVGQIGSGGVTDDTVTTIPLASTTNLPTDTAVVVTIDRVDSSGTKTPTLEESVIGVVSGSNLINCVRGSEGTAQAHNAGAVVEVLVTAKGYNDIIDGFLVAHNQDGTHGNLGNATASTVSASDVTASRSMTACDLTASTIIANSVTARTTNADLALAGNGTGKVKINARYGTPQAGTISASSVTLDMSVANTHTVTLASATGTTLVASNVSVGQPFLVRTLQPAGGSATVNWFTGSTVKWAGGSAPTLTATADKADMFGFLCTSASNYDGVIVGQNI